MPAPPPMPAGGGMDLGPDTTTAPPATPSPGGRVQAVNAPSAGGPPPMPSSGGMDLGGGETQTSGPQTSQASSAPPKRSGIVANLEAGVQGVGEWLAHEAGPNALAPGLDKNGKFTTHVQFDKNGNPEGINRLGLATPENTTEKTLPEYIARGVGSTLPLLPLGGEGGVGATVARGVLGGAGAGAGQYAGEKLAPNDKQTAGLIGSLVGGVAGGMAGDTVADTAGHQLPKGQAVKKLMGDTSLTPDQLKAAINAPTQYQFPGDQPTLAAKVNDPTLALAQHAAKTSNPLPFKAASEAGNRAMNEAVAGAAPDQSFGPADVGEAFTKQLNTIHQGHVAAVRGIVKGLTGKDIAPDLGPSEAADAAQQVIMHKADELGGNELPVNGQTAEQVRGSLLRSALEGEAERRNAAEKAAWNAVPDDVQFDGSDVGKAAKGLADEIAPRPGEPPSTATLGAAQGPIETLSQWDGPVTLRTLQNTRSDLLNRITNARMQGDGQTLRRLAVLQSAIDDSLEKGITAKAAQEAEEVKAGERSPEDTMAARVGLGNKAAPEAPSPVEQVGKVTKPVTLTDLVIANGGVQDQGGEAAARDLYGVHHRGAGRLINPNGMTPDYMRELAEGEGFLPPNSTPSDLWDALHQERMGKPVYRMGDAAEAELHRQQQNVRGGADAEAYQEAVNQSQATAADMGYPDLPQSIHEFAADLMVHDPNMDPEDAVREAIEGSEHEALDRNARMNALNPEGLEPSAQQSALPGFGERPRAGLPAAQETPEEIDEAKAAYAKARATTRANRELYGKNTVAGKALKKEPRGAGYAVPDTGVIPLFLQKGPEGVNSVKNLIDNVGREKAKQLLIDQAAGSLKSYASDNGRINPVKWSRWLKDFSPALSHFPDVQAAFSKPVTAQEALDSVNASHRNLAEAYEKSAAGKWLKADPDKAVDALFTGSNRTQKAEELLKAVKRSGDEAAVKGLQRSVWDGFMRRVVSKYDPVKPPTPEEMKLTAATTAKVFRDNRQMMAKILPESTMQTVQGIVNALNRDAAVEDRVAISRGSNTARDLALRERLEAHTSWLSKAFNGALEMGGVGTGVLTSGLIGGFAGKWAAEAISRVASAARKAGVNTRNEWLSKMYADPELARDMLQQFSPRTAGPLSARIAKRLIQTGAPQLIAKQPHAPGGRVKAGNGLPGFGNAA